MHALRSRRPPPIHLPPVGIAGSGAGRSPRSSSSHRSLVIGGTHVADRQHSHKLGEVLRLFAPSDLIFAAKFQKPLPQTVHPLNLLHMFTALPARSNCARSPHSCGRLPPHAGFTAAALSPEPKQCIARLHTMTGSLQRAGGCSRGPRKRRTGLAPPPPKQARQRRQHMRICQISPMGLPRSRQ